MRTSTAIALGVALNACLLYSDLSAWLRLGAPFVPTAGNKINTVFGEDGLLHALLISDSFKGRSTNMIDLGSGAGALVRAAVREGGFSQATGYEVNGALVAYARLRSLFSPGENFKLQSLWEADVSDADLVFVYGVPPMMERLQLKLSRELPVGAHVVSNRYPFTTDAGSALVELSRTWLEVDRLAQLSPDESSHLYLYQVRSLRT